MLELYILSSFSYFFLLPSSPAYNLNSWPPSPLGFGFHPSPQSSHTRRVPSTPSLAWSGVYQDCQVPGFLQRSFKVNPIQLFSSCTYWSHHTAGASWDSQGFKGKMVMRKSTDIYVVCVGRKGTGACDRRYVSIRTDGASVTSARVRSSWIEELTLWMNEWPKCCYVHSSRVWHAEPCVQERTNLFLGDCVLRVVKSPLSFCFVPSPTTPFQTHTSQAVLLPHIFETIAHLGSIGFCWNYASIDWFNLTGLNFTFSLLGVLVLCPLLSLCGLADSQCINCK